jgi:hypothetical protein
MSAGWIAAGIFGGLVVFTGSIWAGTYNGLQSKDVAVTKNERDIANCYQKRADLIANQIGAVERIMKQEKDVVIGTAEARTVSSRLPAGASPEQISEHIKAQNRALSVVVEASTKIGTNLNMMAFQKDLREQEQQCFVIRKRYIESVAALETGTRRFPSNVIASTHGIKARPQIQFDDEQQNKVTPRAWR